MSRTVNLDVSIGVINVEIDLEDIDTDDLVEELKNRGAGLAEDLADKVTEMFYAFKLGRNDHAMDLTKKIAQDHTGGIL